MSFQQKRAARPKFSEFPPETSKVFTTGLQPQTNDDIALVMPTLGTELLADFSISFPLHDQGSPEHLWSD
jgi:hypothetical protein